ncbi:lipoprotein [Pseudomonas taeanensis MS-3]|jgi:uncharacterized lipoprotein YbaY|uniref:Lipoprotein n=1 Tax=Pseudomonas taeanensis MS-3 TaxID=1395571 RepID=A0A0A1YEZ2_9PSED|nr:YbaY family lipoprotein [Pseudomonas taeanensis]KFX67583.1 lipoprotein [Pseudomonas taeanensis MS-3]
MPLRLFALLSLLGLLAACATKPPVAPQLPAEPPPTAVEDTAAPLPAYLRELSGSLLGVPHGAEAELALLVLDQRGLPDGLLGNIQMRGDGAPLPFRLPFNPQAFAPGARIELRGRVHLSGRLILRLLPLPIRHAQSQSLGELRLVPAP